MTSTFRNKIFQNNNVRKNVMNESKGTEERKPKNLLESAIHLALQLQKRHY